MALELKSVYAAPTVLKKYFLSYNDVDVMLITEPYFTDKSFLTNTELLYIWYCRTVIIIKNKIKHHLAEL